MVFKTWVKNIHTADYNGACMVYYFAQKIFSEWKPYMANIVCRNLKVVKVELKENCH